MHLDESNMNSPNDKEEIDRLKAELNKYPNLDTVAWCQEEPQNQGAWYQSRHNFVNFKQDNIKLIYCGRPASASPAVGNLAKHIKQQKEVVESALYAQSTSA